MQVMMSDPRYLWKGHSIFIILVSRINIFFIYNIIKNENHTLEDSDKMPYIYSSSNLSIAKKKNSQDVTKHQEEDGEHANSHVGWWSQI